MRQGTLEAPESATIKKEFPIVLSIRRGFAWSDKYINYGERVFDLCQFCNRPLRADRTLNSHYIGITRGQALTRIQRLLCLVVNFELARLTTLRA